LFCMSQIKTTKKVGAGEDALEIGSLGGIVALFLFCPSRLDANQLVS